MKKFFQKHELIVIVTFILLCWRTYFLILQMVRDIVPVRFGFLGFLRVGNFDGTYYIAISQYGYRGLDQAFFPLFPLAIKAVNIVTSTASISSALITVSLFLFLSLYILAKLVKLDYKGKQYVWTIIFFLTFPTSFFLGSIYTEGFFLSLVFLSFYFSRRGNVFLSSFFAMLSTATRIIGIFLLPSLFVELYQQKKRKMSLFPLSIIPLGLLSYMGFLWYRYRDPLLFVHLQPNFGAGRSGGELITLPQVIYRYIKIITSVSQNNLTFWIASLELVTFFLGVLVLFLAYKKGIRKSYILFSALALIFPTFSGTLSSIPRYALASFVIFIYLGTLKSKIIKIGVIIVGLLIESVLGILFLQGYFVS